MEKYSIKQAAEKLGLSESALRYYDKLQLVSPTRGENRYRYYTKEDLRELMYVKVMRTTGFTLEEIQKAFERTSGCPSCDKDNLNEAIQVLESRCSRIRSTIQNLLEIEQMLELSIQMMKKDPTKKSGELDTLIEKVFWKYQKKENE